MASPGSSGRLGRQFAPVDSVTGPVDAVFALLGLVGVSVVVNDRWLRGVGLVAFLALALRNWREASTEPAVGETAGRPAPA